MDRSVRHRLSIEVDEASYVDTPQRAVCRYASASRIAEASSVRTRSTIYILASRPPNLSFNSTFCVALLFSLSHACRCLVERGLWRSVPLYRL